MNITFNWKQYLLNYPDLVTAGINTPEKALEHWNNHGIHEGRSCNSLDLFDWKQYLLNYPDLVAAGIDTYQKAVSHFVNQGIHEGRSCNILEYFDWKQYLSNYKDLIKAGIDTQEKALEHWNNCGIHEHRNCDKKYYFFDLNQFLKNNPEFDKNNTDELTCYDYSIKYGKNDNILNFDWKQYLTNYPDLISSRINTSAKALNHWNNHGIHEGRTFENLNILFDWKAYLENNPELVNLGIDTSEKIKDYCNEFDKDAFIENIGIIVIYIKKKFESSDCKEEKKFNNFQNRMELLDLTLSKLYDNFLKNFNYPVLIMYEDYTEEDLDYLKSKYSNIELIFEEINSKLPDFLDYNEVIENINKKPVKHWRDLGYRFMCYFYACEIFNHPVISKYKYYMRLDDDSFIESPINNDLFVFMYRNKIDYIYRALVTSDCVISNEGIIEFFSKLGTEFNYISDDIIPFNNFHIFNISAIKNNEIIKNKELITNIFLKRWGDATIHGGYIKHLKLNECNIYKFPNLSFIYKKWNTEIYEYL